MAGIPPYAAQRSGALGDPGASNQSASINALLGAHPATTVYTGSEILTPTGSGGAPLSLNLGAADWDQPFTMSGTAIGRVVIPVAPVGAGADLTVSLCTDSSGSPGSVIVSTRVAAKVLGALVATTTLAAGSAPPLATSASNSLTSGPGQFVSYSAPAVSINQYELNAAGVTTAGSNILLVGGEDSASAPAPNVFSITYSGGTTLAPPVPQPSLPQGLVSPAVVATPDTLVVAGGATGSPLVTPLATVYTASLNTATGVVGAWSPQTQLPKPLSQAAVASSGENVYVIGGLTTGAVGSAAVYWATVQNGQITAWQTGPAFPLSTASNIATVVNGFLVVASASAGPKDVIYYAPINPDGSLGAWQTGPTIPYFHSELMTPVPGAGLAFFDYIAGSPVVPVMETLAIGATGPAAAVQIQQGGIPSSVGPPTTISAFPTGNGTWQLFGLYGSQYWTQQLSLVPSVSVALPASGLTNGSTLHVVLSQQGGDAADNLLASTDQAVFPGNPTANSRPRFGGSAWTAAAAGTAIPLQLFDKSAIGQPLHTWVDSGARHSSLVYATTPDKRLLGVLEHAAQPAPVLNVNPNFTGGTDPWIVTGGTLAQSPTHTHGSLPFAGLLTPSGTDPLSFIESEQVPIYQGHNYQATVWVYSPTGYSQCAVNINWHDVSGSFLSRIAGTVTAVPAGTWTQLSTTSTGGIPAGAAYASIIVVESGTPPVTAALYVYATIQDLSGPMLPSIAQIEYAGTWPGPGLWPPLGVAQLV